MPPQQAQQPSNNGGGLDSLVADPQFQSLQPSDQRKALAGVSGDDAFGKLSDEDTGRYVKAHQAILSQNTPNNTLAKTSGISAQPKPFTLPWLKQGAWRAAASTADAMPAIGGTVGSMIGATAGGGAASIPGAIGGAGMGGAGGAAAQQIMRRLLGFPDVPQTSGAAAQDITKQGATQATIQGATELLPFVGGKLKNAAETQYERALAPTTKQNKAIAQDIAPQLIQRGEAGSLEHLEKKAGQKIAQINPQLNAQYSGASVQGSGTKIISDLEDLKQTYMPGGNVAQPQAVNAISGIQDIVKQYGPDIPQDHLRRLRQIFEEAPAQSGAYLGADLSTKYTLNAQKEAADSIRGILNKNPDISALNKEISFWLDVQRVTRDSGLRRTGQEGGLMKVLSPLAGSVAGAAGFLEKGPQVGVEAALATTLAGYTAQAMRSPTWRTASAVLKDRFANALARGDVKAVTGLLGRFGVVAMGSQTSGQQSTPAQPPQ
jgi:hypothetical protein